MAASLRGAPKDLPRNPVVIVSAAVVIGLVALGGWFFIVKGTDTPGKLADWLNHDEQCDSVSRDDVRVPAHPALRVGLHWDFASRAQHVEMIACNTLGDIVTYYRFASPAELDQTLASSRSIARIPMCVHGRESFDGDTLDHRLFLTYCRRLGGRSVSPTRPACPTPPVPADLFASGDAEYHREAIQDAGGPCAVQRR